MWSTRIPEDTIESLKGISEKHSVSQAKLLSSVLLWLSHMSHEQQQLILGTLSPERKVEVLKTFTKGASK